jgi:spore coat protein U-like protein
MKRILAGSIAAGLMLSLGNPAQADSKNASFTVSATVAKACAITAADLNMGTWSGAGDLTGTSDITVKCSTLTPYAVDLDAGASSPSLTDRKLLSGTDLLSYNLYRDAGGTEVWGDGSPGTYTVANAGTGMADANKQTLKVYAKVIEANLLAAKPGTYSNLITATVTY